jgi:hypothetical protein
MTCTEAKTRAGQVSRLDFGSGASGDAVADLERDRRWWRTLLVLDFRQRGSASRSSQDGPNAVLDGILMGRILIAFVVDGRGEIDWKWNASESRFCCKLLQGRPLRLLAPYSVG